RTVINLQVVDVITMLRDDACEDARERLGVRGTRALKLAARRHELGVPCVEPWRRGGTRLKKRVTLSQNARIAFEGIDVGGIDARDPAVEKISTLVRRAANDFQTRRGVREYAHGRDELRKRHALFVDQQDAAPRLADFEADRGRLLHFAAAQRSSDENAVLAEADGVREPRGAKRLRGCQEVD